MSPSTSDPKGSPDPTVTSWSQWDASKPLEGAPPRLNRRVGVVIGKPFHHHGIGATYVDITRETPTMNTISYGRGYPVAETGQHARSAFGKTVAELTVLIDHLTMHRDRLVADLASLDDREWTLVPADAEERHVDLPASAPSSPDVVDVELPMLDEEHAS